MPGIWGDPHVDPGAVVEGDELLAPTEAVPALTDIEVSLSVGLHFSMMRVQLVVQLRVNGGEHHKLVAEACNEEPMPAVTEAIHEMLTQLAEHL